MIERIADYPVSRVADLLPGNMTGLHPRLDQRIAAWSAAAVPAVAANPKIVASILAEANVSAMSDDQMPAWATKIEDLKWIAAKFEQLSPALQRRKCAPPPRHASVLMDRLKAATKREGERDTRSHLAVVDAWAGDVITAHILTANPSLGAAAEFTATEMEFRFIGRSEFDRLIRDRISLWAALPSL